MAKQKNAEARLTLIEQLKLQIGNISAAIEGQGQSVFGTSNLMSNDEIAETSSRGINKNRTASSILVKRMPRSVSRNTNAAQHSNSHAIEAIHITVNAVPPYGCTPHK